jgi:hypothetical protein
MSDQIEICAPLISVNRFREVVSSSRLGLAEMADLAFQKTCQCPPLPATSWGRPTCTHDQQPTGEQLLLAVVGAIRQSSDRFGVDRTRLSLLDF